MNISAYHTLLEGSNYEVGHIMGSMIREIPGAAASVQAAECCVGKGKEKEMYRLFDEFCPGINEEIAGFAEELNIPPAQILYYTETFLRPGCSQMVLLPSKTLNGHTILARNYDFKDGIEEMMISTTRIKGRYAHVASSAWIFGRGDGLNEHGLGVSQSGVGIPVTSNMPNTSRSAITGIQFWAVIRSVLENCRNVEEAIQWTREMPIGFNINMLVADKSGEAALIETFNGVKAVKKIDGLSEEQYLCATNHAHLPELMPYAPLNLKNSVKRYNIMMNELNGMESVTTEDVRKLLSVKYPEGLNCGYYDSFFGTIRSQIIDVDAGTMEIRWGSPDVNAWHTFRIEDRVLQDALPVCLQKEEMPEDFFAMI